MKVNEILEGLELFDISDCAKEPHGGLTTYRTPHAVRGIRLCTGGEFSQSIDQGISALFQFVTVVEFFWGRVGSRRQSPGLPHYVECKEAQCLVDHLEAD